MPAITTLEQFLTSKRSGAPTTPEVNWPKRKEDWLAALRGLVTSVEGWLEPLKGLGLNVREDLVSIREDYVGDYLAPSLLLNFGDTTVFLRPRGTIVAGGVGRVDLTGKNGSAMLLLLEWGGSWKYYDPSNNQRAGADAIFTDLDESTFKDIVLSLIAD